MTLSANADRVLLFLYILKRGLPDQFRGSAEPISIQLAVFEQISGLSHFDVLAAFAEVEDAGMSER